MFELFVIFVFVLVLVLVLVKFKFKFEIILAPKVFNHIIKSFDSNKISVGNRPENKNVKFLKISYFKFGIKSSIIGI